MASRPTIRALAVLLSLATLAMAAGHPQGPVSPDVDKLLKSARRAQAKGEKQPGQPSETARAVMTRNGRYIRGLTAPPSQYFESPLVTPGSPQGTAGRFLEKHRKTIGMDDPALTLVPGQTKSRTGYSYVHFGQTFREIPVFGTGILVQLDEAGGVAYVLSDIMTEDETPEVEGVLAVPPAVSAANAGVIAIAALMESNPGLEFHAEPATRMIYLPAIVGNAGPARLVWQTKVASLPDSQVAELVLVDAHSAEIALQYSLVKDALNRRIYDAHNTTSTALCTLARKEGDVPCWTVLDADLAYDCVGDAYSFFLVHHRRDGVDDAGLTPKAYVRCGPFGQFTAFWSTSGYLVFGECCIADDCVGHEYTHGVTQYEANFLYLNESGAIDESFADMWGEWIDQTNGRGDDSAAVKWLIGEDLIPPWSYADKRPALRNMKDPAQSPYCQPDRKGSSYWHDCRTDPSDNGGVHTNCGVGNKLCYLLTDGDKFNGYTIVGMGIEKAADLFYEAQTNLLTSAADYEDLYFALLRAADNLGWTWAEKQNLENACRAVEIVVASWQSSTTVEVETEN